MSVSDPKPLTAMQQVLAIIAQDRLASGVTPDRLDVVAARASLPPTDLLLPDRTAVIKVCAAGVNCHWVVAPGADPNCRLAYVHGGGFVAGGFHSHRSLIGWLSAASGCAILAIEYSLSPEAKYPTQIDEVRGVWEWLNTHGPLGAGLANSLFVAGDSAGAAIAVALMLTLRDSGGRLPAAAAFFCPMLDLNPETSAFVRSSQRMRELVQAYIRDPADLNDALACPMIAPLHGLPPILLQTGSLDDARQDSENFVDKARKAGVAITLTTYPGMFHVWHRFAPLLPEAHQALAEAGAFLAAYRL